MKVDVNELIALKAALNKINQHPLDDIEWYDGENKIEIPLEEIEEWDYTGLSNDWFAQYVIVEKYVEEKK